MSENPRESINYLSADITDERLAQLRQLLPEAFSEGKVDFDKLRAALGDHVDDRPERYSFTWAGKRDAIRLLQTPTSATLVPARDESIEFDDTSHIFIEGENLEVLKLLYKAYFGQVKMIYIDPPYNTGNDFVYPDNYADPLEPYLQLTGQKDAEGNLLSSNTDSSGRYHSTWLNMMYPRLFVARQLLREDGVIFVSIADHEFHNLRILMNEIFGEENFIASLIWQKVYAPKNSAKYFSEDHDFILVYARNAEIWTPNLLPRSDEAIARYKNLDNDQRGPWKSENATISLTSGQRGRQFQKTGESSNIYEVESPSGKRFFPPSGRCWLFSEEKFQELDKDKRIWWGEDGGNSPAIKRFLSEVKDGVIPQTLLTYKEVGHTQEASKELKKLFNGITNAAFPTPKPVRLMERLLRVGANIDEGDIILDFFAGSASLAQAVYKLNKEQNNNCRYILVQLPEPLSIPISLKDKNLSSIAEVGKERIRRATQEFYSNDSGKFTFAQDAKNLDLGFRVFKLAPSHFKPWQGTPGTDPARYNQQLALFRDPLLAGWQPEPVIWEVALKEGYPLHSRITAASVAGHTVYRVQNPDSGQQFNICLESSITTDIPRQLQLASDALFICRDLALDDTTAANLALQCRLKTI